MVSNGVCSTAASPNHQRPLLSRKSALRYPPRRLHGCSLVSPHGDQFRRHGPDAHVLLHFQAVDYDATVWVNGVEVDTPTRGGFTPFSADLAGIAQPGEDDHHRRARADDHHDARSRAASSRARLCTVIAAIYTRTTGIWQTVWLEPVRRRVLAAPAHHARLWPTHASTSNQPCTTPAAARACKSPFATKGEVAQASVAIRQDFTPASVDLHIPADDRCSSGRRATRTSIDLDTRTDRRRPERVGRRAQSATPGCAASPSRATPIKINGEARLPAAGARPGLLSRRHHDRAHRRSPDRATSNSSMAAGFNGARLHQKVFEERFLYHADRLGYLVWGEFGDWGCGGFGPRARSSAARRHLHHPMARSAGARLFAPVHRRLVSAQRDLADRSPTASPYSTM